MPRPQHSVRVFTYPVDPTDAAAGRLELVRVWHYDTCWYYVRHGRAVFVRLDARGYAPLPGRLPRTTAILPAYGVLLTARIDGITDEAIARRNADDAGSYVHRAIAQGIRQALRDAQPVHVSSQRRSGRG